MAVNFLPPIANASQFPQPSVSATPDFHLKDVVLFNRSPYHLENAVFTRNGRGAIGIAGKALKKTADNIILIPAYHCPALVEPFIWLGYQIHFYPVMENLQVDKAMLNSMLDELNPTHVVVVRYFGFNQNVDEMIAMLRGRPVEIIEDCAHSLFRFLHHFDPKMASDIEVSASICSINKILPTVDGGALYLPNKPAGTLQQTSWADELKAFAYLLGIPQALDKFRSRSKAVNSDQTANIGTTKDASPSIKPSIEQEDKALRYFQPVDVESASYRHTHYILGKSQIETIREKRRKNFEYLISKIDNPVVGHPLYTSLDQFDVPYVLPFLLNDDKHFFTLRKNGIQILRWEETAVSECKNSMHYRSHLIQIPCHHQLTKEQMDFVIDTINSIQS
ncbi:DegT/DnrJ/EryC1/StrS family aminotransferase [Aliiglaciecola sp. M165]|uniref:DegT/DnrJ/EryC1/StrS family aminotransferase n=1 Tax=Aliiglaciecola sp. M165 TaxID=2593649 RepID=UPI0011816835|nr:DegT/DnrJ/EryC1/StrS family aminotransferase [Aliiglaciecola sp. M165]TRY30832.1 DegT/DnrJ/EryC1/StrS aminotransferase family protein [Aliiglaciecola sp. M165]